ARSRVAPICFDRRSKRLRGENSLTRSCQNLRHGGGGAGRARGLGTRGRARTRPTSDSGFVRFCNSSPSGRVIYDLGHDQRELSMKRAMAALALGMSLYGGAAFSQDKPVFVFTAIPDQDETRLVERFTRVADYLQSKLAVPVKYLPVKSYPAAVTAFINGQVQLAWF